MLGRTTDIKPAQLAGKVVAGRAMPVGGGD
jgi:hypothetical protein